MQVSKAPSDYKIDRQIHVDGQYIANHHSQLWDKNRMKKCFLVHTPSIHPSKWVLVDSTWVKLWDWNTMEKCFLVCTTSILVGASSPWSQAQYYHLTNDLTTEHNLPTKQLNLSIWIPLCKKMSYAPAKYSNKPNSIHSDIV